MILGGGQKLTGRLIFIVGFSLLVPRRPEFRKGRCVCHPDRVTYQKDCLYAKLAFHFILCQLLQCVLQESFFIHVRESTEQLADRHASVRWTLRAGKGVSASLGEL